MPAPSLLSPICIPILVDLCVSARGNAFQFSRRDCSLPRTVEYLPVPNSEVQGAPSSDLNTVIDTVAAANFTASLDEDR